MKTILCMPLGEDRKVDYETMRYIDWLGYTGKTKNPVIKCCRWIDFNRNMCVEEIRLNFDYTRILMIDSDIVPEKDHFDKLIEYDKDIISGVYPLQVDGKKWSVIQEDGTLLTELPDKLFKAYGIGLGFVLVKKEVIEKIGWPWFRFQFSRPDGTKVDICSEDNFFCGRAKECGFDIWVDPAIKCHHYHNGEDLLCD